MQGHQPHPTTTNGSSTPIVYSITDLSQSKQGKKRGSYNCGRCGVPKKGHVCNTHSILSTPTESSSSIVVAPSPSPLSLDWKPRLGSTQLRRALSFDDIDERVSPDFNEEVEFDDVKMDMVVGSGGLPMVCLSEVLRRLPPTSLLSAANVSKFWRDTSKRVWRTVEELKLKIPARSQIGFVGSVLKKCPGLVRLSLTLESDVDATMLACIAFSCPNLESMEIYTTGQSVNRITGDELGRFVADKRCLTTLKMEGCSNLGSLVLLSSSLSTIWLSDLHSLSKMVFNCPNLKEISLDFSHQGNDNTDLTSMVHGLGRHCTRLQKLHIASVWLSNAVVLALAASNLRELQMLALIHGSEITDASVAAIATNYSNLELLDLSGSSITDNGIGIICNVLPDKLRRFLLAQCPNITSNGIQFATTQLPLLEVMDCGMAICDPSSEQSNECELEKTPNSKLHHVYQKLIIKHSHLRKLSLWGCSGLDALFLNCPELSELNLNSCANLQPERLLLHCPKLEIVHAWDCRDTLTQVIQEQVSRESSATENYFPAKRLADGSKRVRVPNFVGDEQACDKDKMDKRVCKRRCIVLVE
ncbi:F-box/LRR-repeat protein 17-like [Impatiens glandulifera]|uniref:F-box/LRR-repeat protein 17-like n=1 Tax=Impatiens glandulifera TaxID=253017 RepID=UPI001FB0E4D8|nr:F-box/LRR-repeat protein 17-like [Impatiens glandulifera]